MKRGRGSRVGRGSRRGAILALVAAASLSWGIAESAEGSGRHYTLLGAFPGGGNGTMDLTTVAPMNRWQRKDVAILNVFGASSASVPRVEAVWTEHGAVPMFSFRPPPSTSAVARGDYDDSVFLPLVAEMKGFLAGPDGSLGTGDDRRAYFRYAWESNYDGMIYSPCNPSYGERPRSFRKAWRHVHRLFAAAGITRSQLAWVFSIWAGESCRKSAPEKTYPGRRFVDWLGIDVYASCRNMDLPRSLEWIRQRLRDIDGSRPIGVNEVGVSSFEGAAAKNRAIAEYWRYLRDAHVRMSLWFNTDKGDNRSCAEFEKPWAVFGSTYGDSSYTYCPDPCGSPQQYRGFTAYRNGVGRRWVKGVTHSHQRYLSTSRFLGR